MPVSLGVQTATVEDQTHSPSGTEIQETLDGLPRIINHTVTINMPDGAIESFNVQGFTGRGAIVFQGLMTIVSGLTGENSGEAGGGTTSTNVVKPSGGTNWVADEAQGYFVWLGGTDDDLRPILTNTTTSLTIHALVDMEEDAYFEIREPLAACGVITIDSCSCDIRLNEINIDRLITTDNKSLIATACTFAVSNATGSADTNVDRSITFESCAFSSNASIVADDSDQVDVTNTLLLDASCTVAGCKTLTTEIEARDCDQAALSVEAINRVNLGFNAVSCTSTPLLINDCPSVRPSGTGIAGSTNTGTYGVTVDGNTTYDTIGYTTLSGSTNDLFVESYAMSYNQVSLNGGTVFQKRSTIIAYNGNGVGTYAGPFTAALDMTIGGSILLYGLFRAQYDAVTATGTTIFDSAAGGQLVIDVTGGAAATGVRLWYPQQVAGQWQVVINSTASTKNIYPGFTTHTIDGGAAAAPILIAANTAYFFFSTSATNWRSVQVR